MLHAVFSHQLSVVDMSHNRLSDSDVLAVLCRMPKLVSALTDTSSVEVLFAMAINSCRLECVELDGE